MLFNDVPLSNLIQTMEENTLRPDTYTAFLEKTYKTETVNREGQQAKLMSLIEIIALQGQITNCKPGLVRQTLCKLIHSKVLCYSPIGD